MFKLATLLTAGILALGASTAARADDVPANAEETKSIVAALEAMGCKGYDEIEKEMKKDGSYHFEVDDTVCSDGQYDVKFDKSFKMMSKSKD